MEKEIHAKPRRSLHPQPQLTISSLPRSRRAIERKSWLLCGFTISCLHRHKSGDPVPRCDQCRFCNTYDYDLLSPQPPLCSSSATGDFESFLTFHWTSWPIPFVPKEESGASINS
eukprot:scaffold784_cov229-Ochromonas_danica.AAC.2